MQWSVLGGKCCKKLPIQHVLYRKHYNSLYYTGNKLTLFHSYIVVPRVLFDGWSAADFKSLFSSEDEVEDLADAVVKVLLDHDLDGAVIELWSQMPKKKSKLVLLD